MMVNKMVFVWSLLAVLSAAAMERVKDKTISTPYNEASNEKVRFNLKDELIPELSHEVVVPVHIARLVECAELYGDLVTGDPTTKVEGFDLPVTIQTWRLIEKHLPRIYSLTHALAHNRQEEAILFEELAQLDAKSLVDIIRAATVCNIRILLEVTIEVAKRGKILDKLNRLEMDMGPNVFSRIVLYKILNLFGPVLVKDSVRCDGHKAKVNSLCAAGGGMIVSGSDDYTVRIWDMKGTTLAQFKSDGPFALANGKIIAGAGFQCPTIGIFDMQGKQVDSCKGHERTLTSVYGTGDGKIISGSWEDGTIRVWDIEGTSLAVCRGHTGFVRCLCVTPDGKIVSGSWDHTVRVWDMQGNQLAQCSGHQDMVCAVYATKDGKIVSRSDDRSVRIWDMQGTQLGVYQDPEHRPFSVCLTSDNQIVSGWGDGSLRLLDMKGNQLFVCRGHKGSINALCVTEDDLIVSASNDSTIRCWDIQGIPLAECKGHQLAVQSICIVDNKLISASSDDTLRIWDIDLLYRIRKLTDYEAGLLWGLFQKMSQSGIKDVQECWKTIASILK